MDKKQIWNIVLSELEILISKANFKTWLQSTYILEIKNDGKSVIVAVPNSFAKSWLEKKYHKYILEAIRGATEDKVENIVYKVEVGKVKEEPRINIAKIPVLEEKFQVSVENNHGLNPRYTFKNFVVGKGSELAHAACQAVCKKCGKKI